MLDFTAVAKKRSFIVLVLFGGDRVEKLWNIIFGKLLESFGRSQATIKTYCELVSVAT